jgi:hypothetical protein
VWENERETIAVHNKHEENTMTVQA